MKLEQCRRGAAEAEAQLGMVECTEYIPQIRLLPLKQGLYGDNTNGEPLNTWRLMPH